MSIMEIIVLLRLCFARVVLLLFRLHVVVLLHRLRVLLRLQRLLVQLRLVRTPEVAAAIQASHGLQIKGPLWREYGVCRYLWPGHGYQATATKEEPAGGE